jgi:chloride channel 3/4/5
VVGVTKAVSDRFGKGGIADRMIWFNGFPFLDNKEEHSFGVPVSQIATTDVTVLPAEGLSLRDVERILTENKYQGFPIVEDRSSKILLGYIGRTELRYAIDRTKRENLVSPAARCYFTPPATRSSMTPSLSAPSVTFDTMAATAGQTTIDFSRFIDPTPLSVHPRLPLETVMELFKKMGPRVILIEHRGKLAGLVTVKDCLKYQFKAEALENPKDDNAVEEENAKVWDGLSRVVRAVLGKIGGGRVRLGDNRVPSSESDDSPVDGLGTRVELGEPDGVLGHTDEDAGVELVDRR